MEISVKGGLVIKLNNDYTASVTKSPKATGNVFIPRQVIHDKKNYLITSLGKNAFYENNIDAITFPEDSEIITFEKDCLSYSKIKKIQFPQKLKNLEKDWNSHTQNLADIEISPKNKNFIFFQKQYLLGKSDERNDKFDILHYARFDIKEAIIPPQVKILKKNSFSNHNKLNSIIFPENSEAKIIEEFVFDNTPIKELKLPSTLEEINHDNFKNVPNLTKVEVSQKNPLFSVFKETFLLKKTDTKSGTFDQLVFCRRDVKDVKIPSQIKEINENSVRQCKNLKTLTFDPNSCLEIIYARSFSMSEGVKEIVLPKSLKKVCSQAFYCIESLESVQFLSEDVEVGFWSFYNCRNLKQISFPNATKLNFSSQSSFIRIPQKARILVPREAELIGPGVESCQNNLEYIESKPAKKEKKHEEEEVVTNKDDDIQLLLSRIRFLESQLSKYEKVEVFDLETARKQKMGQKQDDTRDKLVFIGEEEEKDQEVVAKIGEGATSIAYKVVDKRTNRVMCKKVLKTDESPNFNKLQNSMKEYEALIHLNHPSICEAFGFNLQEKVSNKETTNNIKDKKDDKDDYEYEYEEDKDKKPSDEITTVALFMEFVPYKIKDCLEREIINNTLKVRISVEVAFGMSHIHSKGMLHRDLKLENVMLSYAYEAKIIDFDLVGEMTNESQTKGIGTFAYMSPEMANEEKYDNKTDVYSYGILLFAIFTGHLPKQSLRDKMDKKQIRFPHSSASMTKYCIDLIKRCTDSEACNRPSFDEIIDDLKNHQFGLAEEIDTKIINDRYEMLDNLRIIRNIK